MQKITVYTDGASRGNPGPSAIGVVVGDEKEKILKQYSESIGQTTNNEAEYQAVIFALKKIKALIGKKKVKELEILIKSDSQLLVSQLEGEYKIKEPRIQKFFIQIWNLKVDYKKVDFTLVSREENQLADRLANQALDRVASAKKLL
jgi:ribonuclease HI